MASASTEDHTVFWDLERRQLVSTLGDAHKGSVCGMKFLSSQLLLVTNGPDNSLKVKLLLVINLVGLYNPFVHYIYRITNFKTQGIYSLTQLMSGLLNILEYLDIMVVEKRGNFPPLSLRSLQE